MFTEELANRPVVNTSAADPKTNTGGWKPIGDVMKSRPADLKAMNTAYDTVDPKNKGQWQSKFDTEMKKIPVDQKEKIKGELAEFQKQYGDIKNLTLEQFIAKVTEKLQKSGVLTENCEFLLEAKSLSKDTVNSILKGAGVLSFLGGATTSILGGIGVLALGAGMGIALPVICGTVLGILLSVAAS